MGKCKRLLTMVLAAVLCCTMLPVTAFAGGGPEDGSDKVLEYWSQGSTPPQDVEQGQPPAEPSAQPSPQPGSRWPRAASSPPATCCTTRKRTSSSSPWRAGMGIFSTS